MEFVKIDVNKSGTAIYIMTTEITQKQWESVMGNNPSIKKGDRLPVEMVTWLDTQEFCKKLSVLENGIYRLPTDEEWKKAAVEGLPSDIKNNIQELRRYAWIMDDGGTDAHRGSHEVATKKPSAIGIYDMLGNVQEWCADKHVRGGSFLHTIGACLPTDESERVSARPESFAANDLGFRVIYEKPTEGTAERGNSSKANKTLKHDKQE